MIVKHHCSTRVVPEPSEVLEDRTRFAREVVDTRSSHASVGIYLCHPLRCGMTGPDRIAVAALVSEGRLLMVHRHPSRRWYPNCWDLVGGHIEAGESPARAVHRECLEELGVRIDTPVPVPMRFSDPGIEMYAFRVTSWVGKPANSAPEEHDDLRWFTAAEIPTLVIADPSSLPDIVATLDVRRNRP